MLKRFATVSAFVMVTLVFAGRPLGDTVRFHDGREMEGDVVEDGDSYVITSRFGKTRVAKAEVREIEKKASRRQQYDERLKILQESERKDKAAAWCELGRFAAENQLEKQAQESFAKALQLDPDCGEANTALGRVRYMGNWVPLEERMAAEGKVKVGDQWVAKELAAVAKTTSDLTSPILPPIQPTTPLSKYLTCSNCSGTGIAKWLVCLQCRHSGKPGYIKLDDRLELCSRCRGQGKLPGVACKYCGATGKVDPNLTRTPGGRVVPKGFHACSPCKGTGVGTWVECSQCKKTGEPGYLNMGDHYLVCDRCNGEARIPGLPCKDCAGQGLIKDK